ncbi:alginate lyase [Pantoea rwandensis]|uniref:Alginate lyase n=2 Tax=Pantoea rwandensis TaxID=1076550 RepID=A0A1X1CQL3_9GAMM|nr:alginate lyase family protein [Pantoea rwandensis]ORM66733.1 alginate lyase [Pantoea rwandensis]
MRRVKAPIWWLLVGMWFASSSQAQLPALAFLSAQQLQMTREALQEKRAAPQSEQAWQQLKRAADHALRQPNLSVTQKGMLPPSGSRHDYLSLSAYWWPDSEKSSGLPWVRRDGEVNPASKNDQSDGVRLARFTADLQTLALAWYFSGETRYAEKAQSMARTWFIDPATRMNPNLNYAQGVPGKAQGRHTGVLDGRYFATRVVDALLLLQSSPGWRPQDKEALHLWFSDYLYWLQHSKLAQGERDAPNNHGSWYVVQVAGIAWYLQQPEVIKQMATLARQKIDGQIRADGTQPLELARTRSFHYSYFNLQALTSMAQLAQRSDAGDLWHYHQQGGSLLDALDYMAPYSDARTPWPWKNRERMSIRLIPLLSLTDNSLRSDRYQRWIESADWMPPAEQDTSMARGAIIQAQRDTWLLSLPRSYSSR